MAIPDYQTLMLPLLRFVGSGERKIQDAISHLSDEFSLSDNEREELLPSGTQRVISSRIQWAGTYLVQAGLIDRPRRGHLLISERGKEVLAQSPDRIDNNFLSQFEEFQNFKARSREKTSGNLDETTTPIDEGGTPEERIDVAYKELQGALRSELLERIRSASPEFFEHLIIDLMLAMGYGKKGGGQHLGQTNDGGVDGIISEDALGLDLVFLQAKRYQQGNAIGSEKIQAFVGSLVGQGANKGVFVTTSHFSPQAKQFAERTPQRIILIDGDELTKLCLLHGVGVRATRRFEFQRIDFDYFESDD